MRVITLLTALVIALTALIESDSQVNFSVEVVCADNSEACDDMVEDINGGEL